MGGVEKASDVKVSLAGRSAQHTADIGSSAVDASDESASPAMGASSSSAPEAAADGDQEPSGSWDSDSDAGYQSAEDWPASPQSVGRAPADVATPAPLRSTVRQHVGWPAALAEDGHQPHALDGALADVHCCSAQLCCWMRIPVMSVHLRPFVLQCDPTYRCMYLCAMIPCQPSKDCRTYNIF